MKRSVDPLILATALLSTGALAAAPAAAPRFQAGLWEVTSTRQGASAVQRQYCYKDEDVRTANARPEDIAETAKADPHMKALAHSGCRLTGVHLAGQEITQTVECPQFSMRTVTTYHEGDTFEVETVTTPKASAPQTSHIKARRLGDCAR